MEHQHYQVTVQDWKNLWWTYNGIIEYEIIRIFHFLVSQVELTSSQVVTLGIRPGRWHGSWLWWATYCVSTAGVPGLLDTPSVWWLYPLTVDFVLQIITTTHLSFGGSCWTSFYSTSTGLSQGLTRS